MSAIFWDTNLFIYLFEKEPNYFEKVRGLRSKMINNNDVLVTSTLTLGEILVRPLREKRDDLVKTYHQFFLSRAITLISLDEVVAEQFARLRVIFPDVKKPDVIQLACASAFGVDEFYTNDNRLNQLKIDNIGKIKSIREL